MYRLVEDEIILCGTRLKVYGIYSPLAGCTYQLMLRSKSTAVKAIEALNRDFGSLPEYEELYIMQDLSNT